MKKTALIFALLVYMSPSYALDVPGPEGVSIELNDRPPHNLLRLRAIGEADIPIGDRKDIQRATKVATLKAKAAIAKYLGEDVKTDEFVEQVSESVQKTNGQVASVSRNDVERLVETIRNSSAAFMKGVVVLEQNVDQANKRVVVTVGASEKTRRAADQARHSFSDNHDAASVPHSVPVEQNGDASVPSLQQEIRRSGNYDAF